MLIVFSLCFLPIFTFILCSPEDVDTSPFGELGFWSFHATLGLVYLPLLPDLLSLLLFSLLTISCEVQHTQKLEKTSLTLLFSKNLCSWGSWVAQ